MSDKKTNFFVTQHFSLLLLYFSILFGFTIFPTQSLAINLGVMGKTFPIVEPDFLTRLHARLRVLSKDGYFTQLKHALRAQALQLAEQPAPVSGLTQTQVAKRWLFNPSITMPQTIRGPEGRVIVKAGAHYNPLQTTELDETLLFYNASYPDQVSWALKQTKQLNKTKQPVKLILVGGSVLAQRHLFHRAIYFDQFGRLTTRLQIHHVPAIVKQAGLRLQVSEVVP